VSRREKREERSAYHLTQQRSSCYCQTREKRGEDRREVREERIQVCTLFKSE